MARSRIDSEPAEPNMLERLMREIKRRTRTVGAFLNRESLERLVGALVIEIDEAWACEPLRYLALDREN